MSGNLEKVMNAISTLRDEGLLSNRRARYLRTGAAQIAAVVNLEDLQVSDIKMPILSLSMFVESQRIKQIKPRKIAGKKRIVHKIVFIPQCIKYPDTKPFCL